MNRHGPRANITPHMQLVNAIRAVLGKDPLYFAGYKTDLERFYQGTKSWRNNGGRTIPKDVSQL